VTNNIEGIKGYICEKGMSVGGREGETLIRE
jgi:hypothetical protein